MNDQTSLNVGNRRDEEEPGGETTGRARVTFDCEYCEEVVRTRTIAAMKDRATAHLETHRSAVLAAFADKERGKHCQNDCGYAFPVGGTRQGGFECPRCGHDNFEEFAHRYLYWRIDYPDTPLGESDRG